MTGPAAGDGLGLMVQCPRCFGKGLEGQDDRPGILLPLDGAADECRVCRGTGRVPTSGPAAGDGQP